MAYAKLSLLSLFLLATLVIMFPMKKVEAGCAWPCGFSVKCGGSCTCVPVIDFCIGIPLARKMVEHHPNLCESHEDCIRKGSGSFCAIYPSSDLKHGACFDSISDAEASIKNALSSKFSKLLKMPSAIST